MFRREFLSLTAALPILAATAPGVAAGALYASPPSATSAFVRFVGVQGTATVTWQGHEFALSDYAEGRYIAIESAEIGVAAADYLTIVVTDGLAQFHFIEEPRVKGKVALQFLNLTAEPAGLATPDGSIAIFEDVAANDLAARLINPVKVPVQASAGAQASAPLELALSRDSQPLLVLRPDYSLQLLDSRLTGNG